MTLMQSFLGLSESVYYVDTIVTGGINPQVVPTHQTGDIILGYLVEQSSSNFPTVSIPSGWTLIDSSQYFILITFPSVGLYFTASFAYKIATDSSTLGWGSGAPVYTVYRGPTGVGIGNIEAGTSSWPAISPFENTNGTSLIMGFGNHVNDPSNLSPDIPNVSGVKSRFSSTSHRVWDSGNKVQGSSWSSYPTNRNDFVYATVELKF